MGFWSKLVDLFRDDDPYYEIVGVETGLVIGVTRRPEDVFEERINDGVGVVNLEFRFITKADYMSYGKEPWLVPRSSPARGAGIRVVGRRTISGAR